MWDVNKYSWQVDTNPTLNVNKYSWKVDTNPRWNVNSNSCKVDKNQTWYVNKYSCIAISRGKLRQYVCVWLLPMGREGEKGSYWESKLEGGALEFGPFAPLNLSTSRGVTEKVHYVCGGKKQIS